jgi:acetyl-CoA carboxylase carboxyl transferase subunit alpha
MLEFAYYSVISPEGCAGILWRDGAQAPHAAAAMKPTSKDLLRLGLIDAIIAEPVGGAHRNAHDTVYNVEMYISKTLAELRRVGIDNLLESRYRKWRSVGTSCVVKDTKIAPPATPIVATVGRSTVVHEESPAAKV